jgi:hypothetical protein
MKKLSLLLLLLIAAPAFAIPPDHVVAMPAGTPIVAPTPGNAVSQACDQYGNCQVIALTPIPVTFSGTPQPSSGTVNVVATPGASSFLKTTGSTSWASTTDANVSCLATDTSAALGNINGKYGLQGVGASGAAYVSLEYDSSVTASRGAVQRISVANDTTNQVVAYVGTGRQDIPAANSASGSGNFLKSNDLGYTYVEEVRRQAFTHTQPSVTNVTSFTCAAANTARRMLTIQNNSSGNVLINLNNGTLTGIVPTSSNLGIVLTPGASYTTPPNAAPVTAVTCYQASGGTINTISVIEQS